MINCPIFLHRKNGADDLISGERADAFGAGLICHWPGCDAKTSLYADERCPIGFGVRVQDAG